MLPINENYKKSAKKQRNFVLDLQKKEKRLGAKKDVNIRYIYLHSFFKVSQAVPPLKLCSQAGRSKLITFFYRPKRLRTAPYPTLLYIRGTAYCSSGRYYSYLTCSHLAEKSGCQVIDIDYRLAPEHPYPAGLQDVYDAYKFIIKYANFFQVDTNKLAISGYSSGGNFASLVAIKAKNAGLPLSLQILIAALTDLSGSLQSHKKFEDKDKFSRELADQLIELYLQNKIPTQDSLVSPYWSNNLLGMPPTYFLFGEFDRFRSENEAYAEKLKKFGIWTHKTLFKQEVHSMFWKNIRVLEVAANQLRMSFNLASIPRVPSIEPSINWAIFNKPGTSKQNTHL